MIASSAVEMGNLEELVPDPRVLVKAPGNDPFVTANSVSFTQKVDGFQVVLAESLPEPSPLDTDGFLNGIVEHAARDVERYPRSARAYVNLGIALLNSGHPEKATDAFEKALEREPDNYVAAVSLARIKALNGLYDEARMLYERLAEVHRENASLLTNLAYLLMKDRNFVGAEVLLRRLVQLDERAPVPRYHLAVALLNLGKNREAVSQLKVAARMGVRMPAVHHALGMAYAAEGDLKRATASLRAALALAPGMREVVHGLAGLYLRQQDNNRAVQLLSEYIAGRGSKDLFARELLAQAYQNLGRYREGRSVLMELFGLLSADGLDARRRPVVMNNIGFLFARDRMLDDAAQWLVKAVKETHETDPTSCNNLARVLLQQGKIAEVSQLLSRARRRFPTNQETRLLLALSLQKESRNDEAIVELHGLIEEGYPEPTAYADLSRILMDEKRDVPSAIRILQKGRERFGDSLILTNNLAYAYLLVGEVASARVLLESVEGLDGESQTHAVIRATWGLLRLWEGDIEEGIAAYKEAELMASQNGDRDLAQTVRQKRHLEVARAYLRIGEREKAASEVVKGLNVRDGRECYREDLESLEAEL